MPDAYPPVPTMQAGGDARAMRDTLLHALAAPLNVRQFSHGCDR